MEVECSFLTLDALLTLATINTFVTFGNCGTWNTFITFGTVGAGDTLESLDTFGADFAFLTFFAFFTAGRTNVAFFTFDVDCTVSAVSVEDDRDIRNVVSVTVVRPFDDEVTGGGGESKRVEVTSRSCKVATTSRTSYGVRVCACKRSCKGYSVVTGGVLRNCRNSVAGKDV